MRNLPFLFLGIFFCIAFSFTVLVLTSHIQFGSLEPVANEEGEKPFPQEPVGIAQQGKLEYIKLGCIYCHSQQPRRKNFGGDHERGWGDRASVARDYILQDRVLLGTMRTGPDLMNVGQRLTQADWHYLHLYDPQITSKGSVMPPFKFLFTRQKIKDKPMPDALIFPEGHDESFADGYEVVPTERARKLVAYLMALKLNYELPEAKFVE